MEIIELKKAIEKNEIPRQLVFVDNCRVMVKAYLKAISKVFNRRIEHIYSKKEAQEIDSNFSRNDIIGVLHGVEDFTWILGMNFPIVVILLEDQTTSIDKVIFNGFNKNQAILYIEDWLRENKYIKYVGEAFNKKEVLALSRNRIEKLLEYFDNDIDLAMGELEKIHCLGVDSLDRPFDALAETWPLKEERLRSLPWYSGGAVDTAQVLFNTYLKKLKKAGEMNVPIQKQKYYSMLIREAVFVEAGILNGTFGEYALEYFKLIEKMKPEDMKIQWLPPISMEDLETGYKEWLI